MKYLCLIYENEKNWETMPQSDAEAIMKRRRDAALKAVKVRNEIVR